MSAELLARAAQTLRDHAEAATPGPWTYDSSDIGTDESIGAYADSPDCVLIYSHYGMDDVGIGLGPKDGRYVALMSPDVALLMASWLDAAAEELTEFGQTLRDSDLTTFTAGAFKVARAILREAAP